MFFTERLFGERAVLLAETPMVPPTRLLLPGPGSCLPDRAARAVDPVAEAARREAAAGLGVRLTSQAEVDVAAAARLCPPSDEVQRHAAAVLELGLWRSRVQDCPAGPQLAALLDERPGDLAPPAGAGAVVREESSYPGGMVLRTVTSGAAPGGAGQRGPGQRGPGHSGPGGRGPGGASWVAAPACGEQWPEVVLSTVQARARLIAHLQQQQYADIAGLSACYPGVHQFLATELGLALRLPDSEAAEMLHTAEMLRDRLPQTRRALAAGVIDDARVRAMVRGTARCEPAVAAAVEEAVLPSAGERTAGSLRRRVRCAVIALDPDGAAARHRRARVERHVWRCADDDGMARLGVYAPVQDVAAMWEAISACADASRQRGDERGLGQRRADALTEICTGILRGGGWGPVRLPDTGRGRPQVRVTMPYTALLGHRAPCDLDGYGPICTEQALDLAGCGDLYRMVCDPAGGQLLDYGRTRYRPPPHLADFVRTRDGQCPMPTCGQPASRGQLDHIIPARPDPVTGRPTHGATSADNLASPCQHHHLAKDAHRGFTLNRARDGTYTWTTPLGRYYTWKPEPLWHPDTDTVLPAQTDPALPAEPDPALPAAFDPALLAASDPGLDADRPRGHSESDDSHTPPRSPPPTTPDDREQHERQPSPGAVPPPGRPRPEHHDPPPF